MKYILTTFGIVLLIITVTLVSIYKNNRKLKQFLRVNFGKIPKYKYDEYDMERISTYWELIKNKDNPILAVDDITWNDLEMDKIFKRINSTCSSVGEEYLYSELHDQAFNKEKLMELERVVKFFDEHDDLRLLTQYYLSKLGKVVSNGIIGFFYNPIEKKLRYHKLYPFLSVAALLSILLLIINPYIGIYVFVSIMIINTIIYLKTRNLIETELISVSYISSLVACAKKLSKINSSELIDYTNRLSKLYGSLKKIRNSTSIVLSKPKTEFDFIFEYLKIFFMLDLVMYNRVISIISKHREECLEIYKTIGLLDMAISVASYRRSVDAYTIPEFVDCHEIMIDDIVHPLILEPVANTILLKRSSLITGSNASGKSTFVKAIAINAIFAQTIHTCLANRFSMKPYFVVTSMAVRDNIEAGESYYIAEIKSLKRVLDLVNDNVRCFCFIDEILKGTNTIERIAASATILNHLSKENCMAIVATHDIELTEITMSSFDNYHFQEYINDEGIDFDYKIYEGWATTRNAIQLLKYMDYQESITADADKLAQDFEENRVWGKL